MTTVLLWTKMMHSQSFGVSYDRDIARRTRKAANICRLDIDTAEIVVTVSALQTPPEVVSAGNLGSFLACAAWASCFIEVVFWLRQVWNASDNTTKSSSKTGAKPLIAPCVATKLLLQWVLRGLQLTVPRSASWEASCNFYDDYSMFSTIYD